MPTVVLDTTKAAALDSDSILAQAGTDATVDDYDALFFASRDKAEQDGDADAAAAYELLAAICTFAPNNDPSEPFRPRMQMDVHRSPLPEDFCDAHYEALEVLLQSVADHELRARIGDVLWHRPRRNYQHAEIAVDEYLAIVRERFTPTSWVEVIRRLERAFYIARSLGAASKAFTAVLSLAKDLLAAATETDPSYCWPKIMAVVRAGDCSVTEIEQYALLAERMAATSEQLNDFERSRAFYEEAVAWQRDLKRQSECDRIRLQAAESYVSQAHGQQSNIAKADLLSRAVTALRNAGAAKERINDVRAELDRAQKAGLDEMQALEIPYNVDEMVEASRKEARAIGGVSGLRKLALIHRPAAVADLRNEVEQASQKYVFTNLFKKTLITEGGRRAGTVGGILSVEGDEREAAIEAEMFAQASQRHRLLVDGVIEPFRIEFVRRNALTLSDVERELFDRPFVQRDRVRLFAKGILSGLYGDYSTAAHFLTPQLEFGVRRLLGMSGVLVYKQTPLGVQDVLDFNQVLGHESLTHVLGEDYIFDLRSLLVERTGENFRNNLAHGLLSYIATAAHTAAYVWWISLHLIYALNIAESADDDQEMARSVDAEAAEANAS